MAIKRPDRVWMAACVAMLLVYVYTVPYTWQCEGVDEIDYLSVGHSLAMGMGYTVYGEPHVLYPPLYPLLLATIFRLFGVGNWRLIYTVNAILGAAGWILIASWLRRKFGNVGKWAAWFLLTAYYPWSFSCRFLMSEPLFVPIGFGLVILSWRVLERNTGTRWEYAGIGLLSLLSAMTRAAALALNLALVIAGLVRAWLTRKWSGVAVASLAGILGLGFFAYWSIRADLVNPNAPESHWRWAKKYLGISKETHGIIAQGEEITHISAVFHRRLLFAAGRCGQFLASVVRPPRGFQIVGIVMTLLLLLGLARHVTKVPWSPLGWYTTVFLAMILKTTWLSNYLRFYIMIAPFLFLFAGEGIKEWFTTAFQNRRIWAVWIMVLALALIAAAMFFGSADAMGREWLYQQFIRWGLVGGCIVGAIWVWLSWRSPNSALPRFDKALITLLLIATLHSVTLIFLRAREGWKNTTLRFRRLDGVVACSQWLRESGCGGGKLVASLPQVPSFLSGCVFEKPSYNEAGILQLDGVGKVMIMGMLREVPFFRPMEEERLARAVEKEIDAARLSEVCRSGEAAVYRVSGFPAPHAE